MSQEVKEYPLKYSWCFWFTHRPPGVKSSNVDYANQMKKIATFSTLNEFWQFYQHLKRPADLPVISDYHLFKDGISPVWEDERNIQGGKWIVRIKKGLANRMWENLIIALISEDFEVGDSICGAVLSLRTSEDIISIWNANADEPSINLKIKDILKRVLNLPMEVVMEYKAHRDAMVDNSSFRNTDIFR